jgi:hypothetical protein
MLQPPSSSSGRGPPTEHEAAIEAFVESLHLETVLLPDTDDFELAMHQLEARKLLMWGKLDPFVRFCRPLLLKNGPALSAIELKANIDQAVDEYVLKGTRLVIRRSLDNEEVSLNELAKEVFNPKSKEFSDFRARLRDTVLYKLADIGLWTFTEEMATSKRTGKEFHKGFKIVAGPVLWAFHRHIYMPWSIRHAEFACRLLAKRRGE